MGDVLDKALHHAGLSADAAGGRAGVDGAKIRDAIDYRSELSPDELRRLASVLQLNEVGFCAVAQGRYPRPEIGALPFCVWPLRMAHGIGVVNAYLVAECGGAHGLLFDVGPSLGALTELWPAAVRRVDAVFLTHLEGEHAGGLCETAAYFGATAFLPEGAAAPFGAPMGEGETKVFGPFQVTAFSTPGHAEAHNCYLVQMLANRRGPPLLISGDLIFAGSAGGGYFCHRQLRLHLRRVLNTVPLATVIAPGHGPLTTVVNELRFNPFVL